jgi:TolA-binding protein
LAARNFDQAGQQLGEALKRFPEDGALLALRESVEAAKAAHERDRKLEDGLFHCGQLRQERRFEEAFREIAQLIAEYGNQDRLVSLKDQIKGDFEAQKRFEALRAIAGQARELIRQGRPEQAIQVVRGSRVDPGLDEELAGLLKIAEGLIAERQESEALRQIVTEASQFELVGDLEQARQTLENGLKQFPRSAELAGAADRIRKAAAGFARQEEIARQCALIEKTIQAGDWATAVQSIEACADRCGQDPRLTALRERALLVKAQREEAEQGLIAEVLRGAKECEARGDLASAVAALEKGLRSHPASSAIGEALTRLQELMRRQELARKIAERAGEVERSIAGEKWADAGRLLTAAQQDLGSQPVFDRLFERVKSGEAAQAAEERRRIQAICDRAWAMVQNQQVAAALQSIEDGLQLYPDSLELAQARAAIAPQITARKRQQRIAEQIAAIERTLSENDLNGALALAEAAHREFPDQPAFVPLIERSKNELRGRALELVIAKVKAALAAGALETARNLLDPALLHFQGEAALAQLNQEIAAEQSRRDKLANAREALQKGRLDAGEKICRELLAIRPNDAEAIATLEQVSIKRAEIEREQADRQSRRAQASPFWKRWQFITAGCVVIAGLFTYLLMHGPGPRKIAVQTETHPQPPPPLLTKTTELPETTTAPTKTTARSTGPEAAHKKVGTDKKPMDATVTTAPHPPPPPPPVKRCEAFNPADYGSASSGSITWTGDAQAKVTISGRKASPGQISKALPGIPVKVDPPPGVNIIEQPSCQSKWTGFVFDSNGATSLTFSWNAIPYQP